ncbi:MAG: hypothetical protein GY934_06220 [Gammaproteobacteria bacterium]|nr:hypothetical protein [Gammaproteobacteria bacterium]
MPAHPAVAQAALSLMSLNPSWQRFLISALLVGAALLALNGTLDRISERYTEQAMQRAVISFALARGLNGVISVAQGTEISIEPMGIGVGLAPGQILDPINDLVERFSWVMLAASVILGALRILLEISLWPALSIGLSAMLLATLITLWKPKFPKRRLLWSLTLTLLLIRFSVPLLALANEGLYQLFLSNHYEEAQTALELTREDIEQTNMEMAPPQEQSLFDRLKRYGDINLEQQLERYQQLAQEAAESTINLIVVYLLQTALFPILLAWLLWRLVRWGTPQLLSAMAIRRRPDRTDQNTSEKY